MPVVPASRQPLRAVPQEAPDPKYLAMAAAMMHAQGKLFKPKAPKAISVNESDKEAD